MRRTIFLAVAGLSLYAASVAIAYLIGTTGTQPDVVAQAKLRACDRAFYTVLEDRVACGDRLQGYGEQIDQLWQRLEECAQ